MVSRQKCDEFKKNFFRIPPRMNLSKRGD